MYIPLLLLLLLPIGPTHALLQPAAEQAKAVVNRMKKIAPFAVKQEDDCTYFEVMKQVGLHPVEFYGQRGIQYQASDKGIQKKINFLYPKLLFYTLWFFSGISALGLLIIKDVYKALQVLFGGLVLTLVLYVILRLGALLLYQGCVWAGVDITPEQAENLHNYVMVSHAMVIIMLGLCSFLVLVFLKFFLNLMAWGKISKLMSNILPLLGYMTIFIYIPVLLYRLINQCITKVSVGRYLICIGVEFIVFRILITIIPQAVVKYFKNN